ncbi:hypothetical protein WJX84_005106 [Apatococcus fuscideae]|uniref:Uncharacterized protein n=1 Tax=Apatococcus fuscideae TaxID=2026836 RepID=A0AAW1SMS8_9CHLO
MGNCTGSQAAAGSTAPSDKAQKPLDADETSVKTSDTKPLSIPSQRDAEKVRRRSTDIRRKSNEVLGQRISADSVRRPSTNDDLARGSMEEMYKMSCHPDVNRNEGLSSSGPDDMSTMYMSHMDRILEMPKDSSKAFRL